MHLPILWDDEALLSLLAPSPLYDDIVECRAAMRRELEALHAALSSQEEGDEGLLGLLDWQHWTWARAIAMSRPYILVRRICIFKCMRIYLLIHSCRSGISTSTQTSHT